MTDRSPTSEADGPDDRDLDEGGLDLTPRTDRVAARSGRKRHWGAMAFLAVLVLVGGFLALKALTGATVFYKNADEAVAEKKDLGTKRFRLQGVVVGQPKEHSRSVEFTVAYNGVSVDVDHTGSEPALFKAGLPVVAEGHWNAAGTTFLSNRILVKHTEDYEKEDDGKYDQEHPDRVKGAKEQKEKAAADDGGAGGSDG